MRPAFRSRSSKGGFTLVEILVAAVVTVILVGILLKITTLTGTTVSMATQKISAFGAARTAFDVMTRNLSQATLNTYLDYYDGSGNRRVNSTTGTFIPVCFGRASDLQFVIQQNVQNNTGSIKGNHGQEVYFQAPRSYSADANFQSVQGLLNACGYYIQFGNSDLFEPSAVYTQEQAGTIAPKYRYRLMQGMEPTENLQVYAATGVSSTGGTTDSSSTWLTKIKNGVTNGSEYITPLADNVIALVVWPRLSATDQANNPTLTLTNDYTYDSQKSVGPSPTYPYDQSMTADQLPPDLQVTMIVLDEASAVRLQGASTTAPATIEAALQGRLVDPTQYNTDMTAIASSLSAAHLNFEYFNTTVAMRESKWSTPQ